MSFFPQLIAGPIVHHAEMMPQFSKPRNALADWNKIGVGLLLFAVGLAKKIVIADTFALWANAGFDDPANLSTLEAWITSLSYTFQLYFDFSGYCDMAMGAALIFNIRLPINFNSPYKAQTIQDFWRRWHITLGRFLRDYIYIPLGGNLTSRGQTYLNLFITFLIGGIWHGAGWGFVIWGALHGVAMILHRVWSLSKWSLPKGIGWLLTFNFVNATWVFFRASDYQDALMILKTMTSLNTPFTIDIIACLCVFVATLTVLIMPNSNILLKKHKINWWQAIAIGITFFIAFTVYEIRSSSEFLYFQF